MSRRTRFVPCALGLDSRLLLSHIGVLPAGTASTSATPTDTTLIAPMWTDAAFTDATLTDPFEDPFVYDTSTATSYDSSNDPTPDPESSPGPYPGDYPTYGTLPDAPIGPAGPA